MRIAAAGVLVVASASLLALPVDASAAGAHHQGQTHCKNDGHKYIEGMSATAHGNKATFTGKALRFHPCGEDDGYFTNLHKTITLTLTPSTKIKVFKNQLNPSSDKTVSAANFPRAFHHRSSEPFYQFSGPHGGVIKLSEHFVS